MNSHLFSFWLSASHFVSAHYLLIIFAAGWISLACLLYASRRYISLGVAVTLGAFWLSYSPSLVSWASQLGTDSFTEAQNFDLTEAWFFLKSTRHILQFVKLKVLLPVLAMGGLIALLLHGLTVRLPRRHSARAKASSSGARRPSFTLIVAACMLLPLYGEAVKSFEGIELNKAGMAQVHDNFHDHPGLSLDLRKPAHHGGQSPAPLDVVVYIGESTTAMNMSLYGYPRPTTPRLDQFAREHTGFLVFHEVFATHTHTAPSLLEALSLAVDPRENVLPISERKRTSIIDLLNQASIPSVLLSNQGSAGTWNMASAVVFKNVSERRYSTSSAYLGNIDHRLERPLDHEFFADAADHLHALDEGGPRVMFLHSYAGHGPYLNHIDPAYHAPVDDYFDGLQTAAIMGDALSSSARSYYVEHYDSAMRYVDASVYRVLKQVNEMARPAVFVYFSDHGDSSYTARGHDSSRFVHEMLRVPFIVYFNDAAQAQYRSIFARLSDAAQARRMATLAQVPATLLQILGHASPDGLRGIGQDAADRLAPIFARRMAGGLSHIRLGGGAPPVAGVQAEQAAARPDALTSLYLTTHARHGSGRLVCHGHANSIGSMMRGALVANCLHVDVMVEEDGSPGVRDASAPPAGLELYRALDYARERDLALWIDAHNIDHAPQCQILTDFLTRQGGWDQHAAMVSFPATTALDAADLQTCASALRKAGLRTAYEVPEDLTAPSLSARLDAAAASGLFTDVSVDAATAAMITPEDRRKNGLSVNVRMPAGTPNNALDQAGMLMMYFDDPNRR